MHIANLDGIRAVAVAVVVVAHLGFGHVVPGGFGVTVFFFLSGYLISTLLLREFDSSAGIALGRFYLRRALRILPPMYVTYALALVLVLVGLNPSTLEWGPVLLQIAFLQNYIQLLMPGHEWNIPGHTDILWSLAVEEHFYLVYPLVLLTLLRRRSLRNILFVLAAATAAVLVWRMVLVLHFHVPSDRIYSPTDTRVDSLLFGCMLALIHQMRMSTPFAPSRLGAAGLAALGLALLALLVTFLVRDPVFRDTWRYTVQGLALMPLFHYAVRAPRFLPFRMLETAPLRWLGSRSYTVYLCSELVPAVVQHAWPQSPAPWRHLLALALILGYAEIMYRLVERPLGRTRSRLHKSGELAGSAVAASLPAQSATR